MKRQMPVSERRAKESAGNAGPARSVVRAGENLATALAVLVEGQAPPALLVTPVAPPVFYAGGSEQFEVQGSSGIRMEAQAGRS
jgi:hypothetical protein